MISYSFGISAFLILFGGLNAALMASKYRETGWQALWGTFPRLIGKAFILSVAVFVLLMLSMSVAGLIRWLFNTASGNRAVFLLLALSSGVFLFFLRKYQRVTYAFTEIAVSILGIGASFLDQNIKGLDWAVKGPGWMLGLLSMIYVMVRGLDNLDVGYRERRDRRRALAEVSTSFPVWQSPPHSVQSYQQQPSHQDSAHAQPETAQEARLRRKRTNRRRREAERARAAGQYEPNPTTPNPTTKPTMPLWSRSLALLRQILAYVGFASE